MAFKKTRNMKVYGMSGYQYRSIPTIQLKGEWLKEIGFNIGDYISITCENGKLVITPDAERAALKDAEDAFMEIEKVFLDKLVDELLAGKEISLTTYREGDKADTGYREEYLRLGFAERELLTEYGYPTQRFVLPPKDKEEV